MGHLTRKSTEAIEISRWRPFFGYKPVLTHCSSAPVYLNSGGFLETGKDRASRQSHSHPSHPTHWGIWENRALGLKSQTSPLKGSTLAKNVFAVFFTSYGVFGHLRVVLMSKQTNPSFCCSGERYLLSPSHAA